MRMLPSRTTTLWYALQTGEMEETDGYGQYTGRKIPVYSAPLSVSMMVSPEKATTTKATTTLSQTGLQEADTRQIITNEMDIPWDNTTILWIGIEPYNNGQPVPHNYVVDSVQRSLFAVGIVAKKVIVSA